MQWLAPSLWSCARSCSAPSYYNGKQYPIFKPSPPSSSSVAPLGSALNIWDLDPLHCTFDKFHTECNLQHLPNKWHWSPPSTLHWPARESILPAETKTTVNNFSSNTQKKNFFHVTLSWLLVLWHVYQRTINKWGAYVGFSAKDEGNPSCVL